MTTAFSHRVGRTTSRRIPVRHGATLTYVDSCFDAAQLVAAIQSCSASASHADSATFRVAKHALNSVEKLHGTTYTGLGKCFSRIRKETGSEAAKLLTNLHCAFNFARHLTELGEQGMKDKIDRLLQPVEASTVANVGAFVAPVSTDTPVNTTISMTAQETAPLAQSEAELSPSIYFETEQPVSTFQETAHMAQSEAEMSPSMTASGLNNCNTIQQSVQNVCVSHADNPAPLSGQSTQSLDNGSSSVDRPSSPYQWGFFISSFYIEHNPTKLDDVGRISQSLVGAGVKLQL